MSDVAVPAVRRVRAVAPWVRTRLRAAPAAAAALALLVAVTAFLAAALPLAVDRYDDAGLRRALEAAGPGRTTVQLYTSRADFAPPPGERETQLRHAAVRAAHAKILALAGRMLPLDPEQSSYGVRTTRRLEVPDPWLSRPDEVPPQFLLVAPNALADHSRLRAGRLPRPRAGTTAATRAVEAAVSAETARKLNIEVGSVLHVPGVERAPLAVRVTGIVEPRAPREAYWSATPVLRSPSLANVPGDPQRSVFWVGALLLPPDAAPAMLGTPGTPERYWTLAPKVSAVHGHEPARLTSAVASLEAGPLLQRVRAAASPDVEADTALDEVFADHERLRSAIGPLVAVAASGTGTVAAVVLLMAGSLAADRRRAELVLLRARGASLRGLAGRLLAETAVVAVPAAALGLAAARSALPGARPLYAVAAAAATALLACAALPLRAVAAHRSVRVHAARGDVAAARPSRRRTVAELTLLTVAVGAIVALRTRGTSDGPDPSGDPLVSLAPVLVGVIAALVLVRLYPLPLRALARPAGRLRGVVGPLSLARAGRTSASAVLPLLALLTALTTAAFGGSVLTGVADARDRAAVLAVGADARVDAPGGLPSGLTDRVRRVPGVRDVTAVSVDSSAHPQDGRPTVPLAGVDPAGYAALARHTGIGTFDADVLAVPGDTTAPGGSAAAPLPALASPAVAERYGTRPFPVRLGDGSHVTVRIVGARERTPVLVGEEFLVVDRAGLPAAAARPTALLVTGDRPDADGLRAAAGDDARVRLRAEASAAYVDSPLQSGAERVYAAAVAAGAGYAVVALLLTLLRAAPERAALLARLRTMGLTRAQGRRLLVLESLPQALLAAAGGTLTAWAAVRLLAPGVDLTTLAVATAASPAGPAELRTDPVSLLVPALAAVVLTVGVAAAQAWWTGRRGSVRELRAGDVR
ncbi:putative ABC transport system permease protein [Streptomyces aureorectus]|uniref:ABC transporter permease n=2 Tax=Streptomyces TaxID=1883 RepID=UPI0017EC21FB|nr:ABC transporter permease [Streptomyces calvus]MBA8978303.1 putative ABC transport system permease protein [Streptomyces calvus]